MDIIIFAAGFGIIALAAQRIGEGFKWSGLPLISGFLFTGIIAGPYILNLIPQEAVNRMGFVDQISLGLIAFAAGGELYLKELKSRLPVIGWVTGGLVVVTFTMGTCALFLASPYIPFMADMPLTGRVAVAILAGAILVARSPSSAIAIISELRARGDFTATAMGVTIIMDVVVIILFAGASSAADALLSGVGQPLGFALLLASELTLSLIAGWLVSKVLCLIIELPVPQAGKGIFILTTGYLVFVSSGFLREATHRHLDMEILMEPLLICMTAGFLTANSTTLRKEFLTIVSRTGPYVYIAFFTLTGASLSLSALAHTWPVALLLFGVRILAIFIGSFSGGSLAGTGAKANRTYWMAFITQAGVGLGLAKEVVVEFPEWGSPFAAIIIATIVLNQIVGPPLFKLAITQMKEAHHRASPGGLQNSRTAVIFGTDGQSRALARSLSGQGWQVALAQARGTNGDGNGSTALPVHTINGFDRGELEKINCHTASVIVTMLRDDDNLRICETAYEYFGTQTLVTRLNHREHISEFEALNVLIVDPSTAIVSLLDHFVRAPGATALLTGSQRNRDVADLPVRNPDLSGIALRDLRLPFDTVIMAIRRRGTLFVPHDFTRLEPGDRVTVMGSKDALREISLRFDRHPGQAAKRLVLQAAPPALAIKEIEEPVSAPENRFETLVNGAQVSDIRQAMDRDSFFELAARNLANQAGVSSATLFEMLRQREEELTTVLAPGLAIPHILIQGERRFAMLIARSREGIIFSEQNSRVHAAFVLVGTADERQFHLEALSAIARIVMDPRFERKWARARSPKALKELLLLGSHKVT